jgi:hypothetical protein
MAGLVKKPVGGSESINEAFGMPASKDAFQQGVEAVTGMLSPGGAAKAIIIPFTAVQATRAGVSKIADQALRTYAKTKDNTKVLQESNQALKAANTPMAIEGMFVGPDGKLRATLSNQAFQPKFNSQLFTVDPTTNNVVLKGAILGGGNTVRVQNVLPHESLYALMPELKDTRLKHDPSLDNTDVLGYFDPASNEIGMRNVVINTPGLTPLQDLASFIIHEFGHGGQNYGGTRTGSQAVIDPLLTSLTEAKNMGSFSTTKQLDETINTLLDIEFADAFPELASSRVPADINEYLFKTYKNIYGEVEARQGQNLTPGRLPDIKRLERSY